MMDMDQAAELFGHTSPSEELRLASERFLAARKAVEVDQKIFDLAKSELEDAQKELLRIMTERGEKKIDFGNHSFVACATTYYSAADNNLGDDAFVEWLYRYGGQGIVKQHIDGTRFGAYCRSVLAKGETLPSSVRTYIKTIVQVRKKGEEIKEELT